MFQIKKTDDVVELNIEFGLMDVVHLVAFATGFALMRRAFGGRR